MAARTLVGAKCRESDLFPARRRLSLHTRRRPRLRSEEDLTGASCVSPDEAFPGMAKDLAARSRKWAALGGPSLTYLVEQVTGEIVPFFLANGFRRVSRYMDDPGDAISARQIRLERRRDGEIEGVSITFDKYHRPAFQIQVERRVATGTQDWVRAANVVKRPGQYLCFWGAPWWLPARLWPRAASRHVAARVRVLSPATLAFLDDGRANRHLRSTAAGTL